MTKIRRELLRDDRNGKLAGVCAGIADYFGWEVWLIRLIVVTSVLLGLGGLLPVLYVAAWFILEKKSVAEARQGVSEPKFEEKPVEVKTRVWQRGEVPKSALHHLVHQFNGLELRLRDIESHVTSARFQLNRELNKL